MGRPLVVSGGETNVGGLGVAKRHGHEFVGEVHRVQAGNIAGDQYLEGGGGAAANPPSAIGQKPYIWPKETIDSLAEGIVAGNFNVSSLIGGWTPRVRTELIGKLVVSMEGLIEKRFEDMNRTGWYEPKSIEQMVRGYFQLLDEVDIGYRSHLNKMMIVMGRLRMMNIVNVVIGPMRTFDEYTEQLRALYSLAETDLMLRRDVVNELYLFAENSANPQYQFKAMKTLYRLGRKDVAIKAFRTGLLQRPGRSAQSAIRVFEDSITYKTGIAESWRANRAMIKDMLIVAVADGSLKGGELGEFAVYFFESLKGQQLGNFREELYPIILNIFERSPEMIHEYGRNFAQIEEVLYKWRLLPTGVKRRLVEKAGTLTDVDAQQIMRQPLSWILNIAARSAAADAAAAERVYDIFEENMGKREPRRSVLEIMRGVK